MTWHRTKPLLALNITFVIGVVDMEIDYKYTTNLWSILYVFLKFRYVAVAWNFQ